MKSFYSFLLLFLSVVTATAQNIKKVSFGQAEGDYYLAIEPEGPVRGALILLPGFGQNPESIFPESKIQNVAYSRGLLTIAIAGGQKLHCDETVTNKLERGLSHVRDKYKLAKDAFVMGGFSAGGTISLRYAQLCHERPETYPISPQAVFSVDSPVDLEDLWHYFQRELKKNYSEAGEAEARFVSALMLKEIGDPATDRDKYQGLSPFSYALTQPGNEQHIKDIPVRIYGDIDVEWLIRQRGRSLYDSNALNASELINRLYLMGNEQAEFVTAKQPGMRSNGQRHPHSWSIVDEVDLVNWALKALGN